MLKFLGLLAVFLSCVGFGFYKSFELIKRKKLLSNIHNGMKTLENSVAFQEVELNTALKISFEKIDEITVENSALSIKKGSLRDKDFKMLTEFFEDLGTRDLESEIKRITLYRKMTADALKLALEEAQKGVRLWQTVGVSLGLCLVIFLV